MKGIAITLASIGVVVLGLSNIFPQQRDAILRRTRPRVTASSKPRVIEVRPGDNLQMILNEAAPGDTIVLRAGASYIGNLTLPRKYAMARCSATCSRASPSRLLIESGPALIDSTARRYSSASTSNDASKTPP